MIEYAEALFAASVAATPGWVRRCVERVAAAQRVPLDESARRLSETAALQATEFVATSLRVFLDTDVDAQRTNPLSIFRQAAVFPTQVLASLGAEPVSRRRFEMEAFPNDAYDLTPATWSDIDESLHEPGIVWGAWKAKTVLDRRRAAGQLGGPG